MLTNRLGPTSSLKELKLTGDICSNLNVADITTIMEAVERSPMLESLHIEDIDTDAKCQAGAASLAEVRRLKSFPFSVVPRLERNRNMNVKRRFM